MRIFKWLTKMNHDVIMPQDEIAHILDELIKTQSQLDYGLLALAHKYGSDPASPLIQSFMRMRDQNLLNSAYLQELLDDRVTMERFQAILKEPRDNHILEPFEKTGGQLPDRS